MIKIEKLKSGDFIIIELLGKEVKVEVFSTGDNQFDKNVVSLLLLFYSMKLINLIYLQHLYSNLAVRNIYRFLVPVYL